MYVVDRVNSRIQVFDLSGKFLDQWPNIVGAYGKLVPGSTWGTMGIAPGAIWGFHFFTTDNEGTLYVGEDMAFRIQKFVPRKDGNPVQIIGPLMR